MNKRQKCTTSTCTPPPATTTAKSPEEEKTAEVPKTGAIKKARKIMARLVMVRPRQKLKKRYESS